MTVEHRHRRVNIMISEDQYRQLQEQELNISGLIRDLLGDHLSESTITVQVSEETRRLYDMVVSNTGTTDYELEGYLKAALAKLLEQKIVHMQSLHQRLVDEAKDLDEDECE